MQKLFKTLTRSLNIQECWLCHGFSRGAMLCGFCKRALPRSGADFDTQALGQGMGLDHLAIGFKNLFPMDTLIKQFKYQGDLVLTHSLASLFPAPPWGVLQKYFKRDLVLVPVPASVMRIRSRGFDPMFLLAKHYAKRCHLPIHSALRKQEVTAQAQLGRRDRRRNLMEVFEIQQPGQAVLLMDDVITTGATLSALAERCRDQGAKWVGAVVLARTLGPSELPTQY